MLRRWRPAQVSGGLLLVLLVLLLAAVGFYAWGFFAEEELPPPNPNLADQSEEEVTIYCGGCGEESVMTFAEAQALPSNDNLEYECPKCGEMKAMFNKPSATTFIVP